MRCDLWLNAILSVLCIRCCTTEVVHVNELIGGAETGAYLVKYDSVHGTWTKEVEAKEDDSGFTVDGRMVTWSGEKSIAAVNWQQLGVQIVCDCTGVFLTKEKLQPYFDAGVARVVVSAPVKEEGVLNVVMGCNDHLLSAEHVICTAASCTTNCLAPAVKVVHENLKIKHGCITTVHNVTGTQVSTVDCIQLQ
jgi:glyceraldehyde 3-phosphate dehydrogenase